MPGWKKHKLESRFPGEMSITSDMQIPPLWQKVKRKTKIMASSPITSWQIDGGNLETVIFHFIFLGSKINADGDFSHRIKRLLLHGRKAMTNLDSISKGRDITLSTKVHLVKLWFFQSS